MDERVFLYHAHGFALGGRIHQPIEAEVDSHAATSLSIVGGYASSKQENYRLKDLISYKSAHTYISGIANDDSTHSSVANTVIEGLNILDVITADAITSRLSAKHKDGQATEIIPVGSSFENLRIAGQPVEVELINDLFSQHPTHDALLNHFKGKCNGGTCNVKHAPAGEVRHTWGHPPGEIPEKLRKGMLVPADTGWAQSGGRIYCSLVKHVRHSSSAGNGDAVPYGHAIHIPQVGRIYLGEIFVSEGTKQLTMMRVELGSPVVGRIAVGGTNTNGQWYP